MTWEPPARGPGSAPEPDDAHPVAPSMAPGTASQHGGERSAALGEVPERSERHRRLPRGAGPVLMIQCPGYFAERIGERLIDTFEGDESVIFDALSILEPDLTSEKVVFYPSVMVALPDPTERRHLKKSADTLRHLFFHFRSMPRPKRLSEARSGLLRWHHIGVIQAFGKHAVVSNPIMADAINAEADAVWPIQEPEQVDPIRIYYEDVPLATRGKGMMVLAEELEAAEKYLRDWGLQARDAARIYKYFTRLIADQNQSKIAGTRRPYHPEDDRCAIEIIVSGRRVTLADETRRRRASDKLADTCRLLQDELRRDFPNLRRPHRGPGAVDDVRHLYLASKLLATLS